MSQLITQEKKNYIIGIIWGGGGEGGGGEGFTTPKRVWNQHNSSYLIGESFINVNFALNFLKKAAFNWLPDLGSN